MSKLMSSGIDSSMQAAVAGEVNKRMTNAVQDLQDKYASGKGGMDASETGPTGEAYQEERARELEQKKKEKAARQSREEEAFAAKKENQDLNEEEDADEDEAIRTLREKRLQAMKKAQKQKIENLGKGHGQYREIVQDEFLSEVTSSQTVICHFYHDEFPRCRIMDHHLTRLATRHVETKFIKINAAKAPFFVEKLSIRTMPTLVFFSAGVTSGKLIGFDGLSDRMPEGKADEWPTIFLARMLGEASIIDNDIIVDDDEVESNLKAKFEKLRKDQYVAAMQSLMDDDDFSDSDM